MAGERTEAATPRRRREARQEGQVGKSLDLTVALTLLATLLIVQQTGGAFLNGTAAIFREAMATSTRPLTLPELQPFAWRVALQSLVLVAPLLLGSVAVSLAAGLGQVGLLFSLKAVSPQLSRLNPLLGLQRLFSARGLVELGKALTKVLIVGLVGASVLAEHATTIITTLALPPLAASTVIASIGGELALKSGLAYLILAAFDYAYQRFEYEKSLRMTREEVKQEVKQQEGNPEIKSRIKRIQRQIASGRMMAKVPKATVVITNPTHYAAALAYDAVNDRAPRLVAKGVDLIALQIKRVAAEHGVPCVENVALARLLYTTVELDAEIPSELYQAVAEVLAYIYRLRGQR
ncbi:MAG: flagellar biosynthesis protein FlhB [Chloroflexi bacterium]|nr:flagellar biosynthesis protein FlhB [Chloroflexota bacterium]